MPLVVSLSSPMGLIKHPLPIIIIEHYGIVLPAMENILHVFVTVRLETIAALIVTTEKYYQESIRLRLKI